MEAIENCIMRKEIFFKQRTYLLPLFITKLYIQLVHAKFVMKQVRSTFSLLYQTFKFELAQEWKCTADICFSMCWNFAGI